eukprot:CAMPEP_0114131940 /NCGR_PEP_ID=MMETSP0043_2-20121206/12823_1 /TAXON_ID=464988 /ORGANISM="Hemiselmis andersenii, Strain CCMP644" /LENGTH=83 /DNA_ID=CAMNT_0001225409 /DNA_START=38 /DNA_END=289 /DNA_ORIENTATION=-
MGNIVTTTPNQVAVISGPRGTRMIIGGCGFQVCLSNRAPLQQNCARYRARSATAPLLALARPRCEPGRPTRLATPAARASGEG